MVDSGTEPRALIAGQLPYPPTRPLLTSRIVLSAYARATKCPVLIERIWYKASPREQYIPRQVSYLLYHSYARTSLVLTAYVQRVPPYSRTRTRVSSQLRTYHRDERIGIAVGSTADSLQYWSPICTGCCLLVQNDGTDSGYAATSQPPSLTNAKDQIALYDRLPGPARYRPLRRNQIQNAAIPQYHPRRTVLQERVCLCSTDAVYGATRPIGASQY